MRISILVPIWNDWDSARLLCREIDGELRSSGFRAVIWLVDDGSTQIPPAAALPGSVNVIRLRGHYGHQRAIAAGLGYLHGSRQLADAVIVMDGDGEDSARDVPRLLTAWRSDPARAVVAMRSRRESSRLFRCGYAAYRGLFLALTGRRFNFGNFLLLPPAAVETLCASGSTPRHLAASILRLGIPYVGIATDRGRRYFGRSRMSPLSLARHALAAFAVYFGLGGSAATPTDCARDLIAGVSAAPGR